MYIDTHCHLNFSDFDADRAMVIGNAKKAGVKKFINPGDDIKTSLSAAALSLQHPGVIYASVGVHPYNAGEKIERNDIVKIITKQTIAIGECGLDYHPYKGFDAIGKKDEQIGLFDTQLRIALEFDLPVIIHSRDAFSDIFNVLDQLPTLPRGVFHCFSGGLEDIRNITDRGFYIGLDGNATYSKQLAMVIPHIPLSRLLLETDSPYLPPEGHRGKRCEPKYVPLIAQTVAKLQDKKIKEIEEQTTKNAIQLFHL
ncbi:MAG: TatD family hydrolase [Candidatus Gottesmanbacteria bacterium]